MSGKSSSNKEIPFQLAEGKTFNYLNRIAETISDLIGQIY